MLAWPFSTTHPSTQQPCLQSLHEMGKLRLCQPYDLGQLCVCGLHWASHHIDKGEGAAVVGYTKASTIEAAREWIAHALWDNSSDVWNGKNQFPNGIFYNGWW